MRGTDPPTVQAVRSVERLGANNDSAHPTRDQNPGVGPTQLKGRPQLEQDPYGEPPGVETNIAEAFDVSCDHLLLLDDASRRAFRSPNAPSDTASPSSLHSAPTRNSP